MSSEKTFYLIDFENVHDNGLTGIENLSDCDYIYLFSTDNTPNIKIHSLNKMNNLANFHIIEIPAGDQSLDKHLISYLGYLIGAKGNYKYIIVSSDKGYDKIISFWKKKKSVSITRQPQIATDPKKSPSKATTDTQTVTVPKKILSKTTVTTLKNDRTTSVSSEKRKQLNKEIQSALGNTKKYESDAINKIASIAVKCYKQSGEKNFSRIVHNELGKVFEEYQEIYSHIKSILYKYSN